jgi:hypothetical protein
VIDNARPEVLTIGDRQLDDAYLAWITAETEGVK